MLAALNKYGYNVTRKQYLHEWDLPMTTYACEYAGFPKEVVDSIWEKERNGFSAEWGNPIKRTVNG